MFVQLTWGNLKKTKLNNCCTSQSLTPLLGTGCNEVQQEAATLGEAINKSMTSCRIRCSEVKGYCYSTKLSHYHWFYQGLRRSCNSKTWITLLSTTYHLLGKKGLSCGRYTFPKEITSMYSHLAEPVEPERQHPAHKNTCKSQFCSYYCQTYNCKEYINQDIAWTTSLSLKF